MFYKIVGKRTFQAHDAKGKVGEPAASSVAVKRRIILAHAKKSAFKAQEWPDLLRKFKDDKGHLRIVKTERFEVQDDKGKRVGHAHDTSSTAKAAAAKLKTTKGQPAAEEAS